MAAGYFRAGCADVVYFGMTRDILCMRFLMIRTPVGPAMVPLSTGPFL